MHIVSAHCVIETEKYPDEGIFLSYDDDEYFQGFSKKFRALTKDNMLQAYINDDNFRTSNVRDDDVGYKLYVFAIRYRKTFTSSQPIKVEFKIDGVVPNDSNGYALVLTKRILSTSSDGQRMFDLV